MREIDCPGCGTPIGSQSVYCKKCGAHRPVYEDNFCENPECIKCSSKKHFEPEDQYCDICGTLTTYGKKVNEYL